VKKLRVLVLMHESLVPPEDMSGIEDYTKELWKSEYDVLMTLESNGHEVKALGVYDDLGVIKTTIQEWSPDIAFNMLEEFGGEVLLEQNVVSYLELLRVPYTGCSPMGLLLARDKALSKKLVPYHKVPVPRFQVFPRGRRIRPSAGLPYPGFVKSLIEEASLGISRQSIVESPEELAERVGFIHEKIQTDAIVEQYIDGREIYVGVLGNKRLTVFPPWELALKKAPEGTPVIATRKVKFDTNYQKKLGVKTFEAKLSDDLRRYLQNLSKRIFRILNLNGYARMDFRLTADDQVYFLEANPNPQLAFGEDFAESAEKAGLPYEALLDRILKLGLGWRRA